MVCVAYIDQVGNPQKLKNPPLRISLGENFEAKILMKGAPI